MNSTVRANGLDGLRGLAAAAVVLLHVWMFSGAHQAQQSELVDTVVGAMGLSLMMFFVLSGLLVATPWIRAGADDRPAPDLWRYTVRRAARILPAYWLCLAGSFLLMRAIDHPLGVSLGELPLFAVFAQNQFTATAGQLNPPLWSLGVEVAFYVALPLFGLALIAAIRRFGRGGALLVAGAMIAVGLIWTAAVHRSGDDPTLVAALPTYLPIFACGIATAALLHRRTIARPARTLLLVAGAGLVYLDGSWHAEATGTLGHVLRDLPAGVGFAMIAAAVVQGPAKILGSLPLRRLGDYSYGIYLWHMPVLYFLHATDRWPESPWTAYAYVLGIATVLGAASWYLVERHVVTWAGRRLSAPRHNEAPAPAPAPALEPTTVAPLHRRATPAHRQARPHVAWAGGATPPARDGRPRRPVVRVARSGDR